jgi:hypothetical protein
VQKTTRAFSRHIIEMRNSDLGSSKEIKFVRADEATTGRHRGRSGMGE